MKDWETRNSRLVRRSTMLAVASLCALSFGIGAFIGGKVAVSSVSAAIAGVLFVASMCVMEYANALLRERSAILRERRESRYV